MKLGSEPPASNLITKFFNLNSDTQGTVSTADSLSTHQTLDIVTVTPPAKLDTNPDANQNSQYLLHIHKTRMGGAFRHTIHFTADFGCRPGEIFGLELMLPILEQYPRVVAVNKTLLETECKQAKAMYETGASMEPDLYPNIQTVNQVHNTLPVSTATVERGFCDMTRIIRYAMRDSTSKNISKQSIETASNKELPHDRFLGIHTQVATRSDVLKSAGGAYKQLAGP